ncbi:long-chain-fatty-acid--CoA ligase [Nocardia sp. NPDC004860]|uniref:long-chain-fatty-acid--CoA ligase n=1 Tax=Nocardia sp. NPDC004860 TaxID=3154557 RepID=UPI0033B24088
MNRKNAMWRHQEIHTIPDIASYWAQHAPDKIALAAAGRSRTYAELEARSNTIADAITASGIAPGSYIGYLGKNSIAFFEIWFGANKAGCGLAPFNWRCTVDELIELTEDAQTPLLFADAEFADVAEHVHQRVDGIRNVVVVDAGTDSALDTWLDDHGATDVSRASIADGDIAMLCYTSGTTAQPKGVPITHRAFQHWFLASSLEQAEKWSSDDVTLMVMPNFHLAGSWVSIPALYHGGTLAILPAFDPKAFLAAVTEHRPTVTCLVPTAMQLLLDDPATANYDFSSLRRMLYAGSPINPATLRRAIEVFDCDLMQFYGTTETYIITLLRPEQHDPDNPQLLTSCGSPLPLVEIKIVDPFGEERPDSEIGEVLVRSPWMFAGYWNRPDATASALVAGWYRTGDLGRRGLDGNLYLVDRLKDMIVTGGENVYSAEVERALLRHPAVRSAAVIGAPDAKWGERIVAFVVLETDDSPTAAEDLIAHCRSLIAGYKVPKDIRFTSLLPATASGKIQKAILRERLIQQDGQPK